MMPAMKMSPLRIGFIALGAFVLVTVLGGSAIWQRGGRHVLDIAGRGSAVTAAPAGLGEGWGVYGGDAGGARYSASDEITPQNVDRLEEAWTYHTRAFE